MKKLSYIFALVLFLMPFTSRASLLVEPVLGLSYASTVDIPSEDDYHSGLGFSLGGRVGYQTGGLQLGLDYLSNSIDMANSDFKRNVEDQEWAGFVGYELPALFRLYAGYIFSADGTTKVGSQKIKLREGDGFKFGLGFTLLPFIDMNLEYRNVSFNRGIDYGAFMFGLSLPINLF